MNKIKVLHCADLHLGAEMTSIGSLARVRREELLLTFYRIISICKDENVQLLLIAGDLFEGFSTDKNTINSVKEALANIPTTIVAIVPGNHDYMCIDSPFADEGWSENVTIFKGLLEAVEFPTLGLRLWGAAFRNTYENASLLTETDIADDELINIGVLHGDLVAENQSSNYNPISALQMRYSGFDYLALGHIHKRTEILQSGGTFYAYPGCPEGKGFDELEEKGVYIGMVQKGRVDLAFRPVYTRMNVEMRIDITGATTNNEVAEIVLHSVKQKFKEAFEKNLYKIILEGALNDGFAPDVVAIALTLQGSLYFVKLRDETHMAINMDELSKETSLKGIFVRKMLAKMNACLAKGNEEEASQFRRALYIGLKAFDSEVTINEN